MARSALREKLYEIRWQILNEEMASAAPFAVVSRLAEQSEAEALELPPGPKVDPAVLAKLRGSAAFEVMLRHAPQWSRHGNLCHRLTMRHVYYDALAKACRAQLRVRSGGAPKVATSADWYGIVDQTWAEWTRAFELASVLGVEAGRLLPEDEGPGPGA
jgi:hypothetical protein